MRFLSKLKVLGVPVVDKMKEIFNIFSKSREQITKKVEKGKIIIDYREKNSLVPAGLIQEGFEVEFRELKIGDYIAKDVVIERKTVSDFISSMINKRISHQLEELKSYEDRLLIIEGIDEQDLYSNNYSEEKLGMHPNSIRGFLLSILIRHKIPIIFTKDSKDTVQFISLIMKRKAKEVSLNVSKKSLNSKERLQFILEGFPGIGPKTAQKLLSHLNTLKNIFNTPVGELEKIIGKKAEIFKIVEEEYK